VNILELTDAIRQRLESVFEEFRLQHDNPDEDPGTVKTITIYDGYPPKVRRGAQAQENGPQLPCVVVRPSMGEDGFGEGNARMSWVEVEMYVVAQRIEDAGYRDLVSIIQKIRTDLLAKPYIEKKYRVELPLKWEIGEDETYPQWYGRVVARIILPQPVELFPEENEVFYGES